MGGKIMVEYLLVAMIAMDGSLALRRDRPYLHIDAVPGRLVVIDAMIVASRTVPVFPAAAKMAAGETQPEIIPQLTFLTMSHGFSGNFGGAGLV